MEISPIAGVCGASLLKPPKEESDMPSALAVDASGRTGDDTYEASDEGADRGPEEEMSGQNPDSEVSASEGANSAAADTGSRVNLFA